jgi:STE24 endopeptidase
MTLGVVRPSTARARPAGLFGVSRVMIAGPAMIGSVLLLLVLFGWMGGWEAPALLAWLAGSLVTKTRIGERIVLRVGFAYRRPTDVQAVRLLPLWVRALRRCGIDPRDVDLYVRNSGDSNAFAGEVRSVAVTTGLLSASRAGRLTDDQLVAVLVHELGHLATPANRYGLVTLWPTTPWRLTTRVGVGIASVLARPQPSPALAVVIVAGIAVATDQAVQAKHWSVALVLTGVTLAAVLCPVAGAALSRRSELDADRYAEGAGLGLELASALQILGSDHGSRPNAATKLFTRHPPPDHAPADRGAAPRRGDRTQLG